MTDTLKKHNTSNPEHLDESEYVAHAVPASVTQDGLMPAGMIYEGVLVEAPRTSTRPGRQGMRAVGNGYYYRKTQDGTWKRVLLEDF